MTEILFFDDNITEIKPVARALEIRTGLITVCTDDIDQTLELVRTEQIKVVVLDQRMEEKLGIKGTDLYDRISSVDKRVRGIIFSGQSEKADLVEANTRGLRYIDKGCKPEELAQVVLLERSKYLAEAELDYDRSAQKIGRFRQPLFSRPGQVVELLTVEDLTSRPEVQNRDYELIFEIGSGQTRHKISSSTLEEEVIFERESQEEFESGIKLSAPALKELSLRLRNSLKNRNQLRSRAVTSESLEETAQLSKADEQAQVIHRRLERAPAFVRRRVVLRVTCECCGERRILTLHVRQWSGRYHVRQLDTYRDGRTEVYDLGER